ncbi:MAG: hypothetical protein GX079_00420 [Tissierellia bacterium]|nr:hypothetical protein [Tissierellia bacterium]
MKIAIVGPNSPIAQAFLNLLEETKEGRAMEITFYHKSGLSPLIEFSQREYPVTTLNIESLKNTNTQAILFFPQEDYSKEILEAEALDCKVIDVTGAFIADPTVPLVIPRINKEHVLRHNLISLPSQTAAIFAPLLDSLDKRFTIRRASVFCQDKSTSKEFFLNNDYCTEEIDTINEISKILDNDSLRLTVTNVEKPNAIYTNYFVNISMAKPFNTDELLSQLKNQAGIMSIRDKDTIDFEKDLILRRYRRDLSLDSGIHLCIATKNPSGPLLEAIVDILEIIKAG